MMKNYRGLGVLNAALRYFLESGREIQMKVKPTIEDKVLAHTVALERIAQIQGHADASSRYDRELGFHDYVAQVAESIVA